MQHQLHTPSKDFSRTLIFRMTLNELIDPTGQENVVCYDVVQGEVLRPPPGTTPIAVKINKF